MRIVILAAGRGTRLGADTPKPLVLIDDRRSLLSNQIDSFRTVVADEAIRLIVGFEADRIQDAFPTIETVENARFASTNTAASLLVGLQGLENDVCWANADVYFEPDALQRLLAGDHDSSRILAQPGSTDDEAVKYTLDSDGAIAELSKEVRNPDGESLGVNFVRKEDLPAFRKALEGCADDDYFERAIAACVAAGDFRVMPVPVGSSFCREVDFPEDLEAVRRHVAS